MNDVQLQSLQRVAEWHRARAGEWEELLKGHSWMQAEFDAPPLNASNAGVVARATSEHVRMAMILERIITDDVRVRCTCPCHKEGERCLQCCDGGWE